MTEVFQFLRGFSGEKHNYDGTQELVEQKKK